MLAQATAPVDADAQGVLFYLYTRALAALRDRLVAAGVCAGAIRNGAPGPEREMRVDDPDRQGVGANRIRTELAQRLEIDPEQLVVARRRRRRRRPARGTQ